MSKNQEILNFFSEKLPFALYANRMVSQGVDFHECIRIGGGLRTFEEWFEAWHSAGQKWEEVAREAELKAHRVTARQAFLLASSFYRATEFFLSREDERKVPAYMKNCQCFEKAASLYSPSLKKIEFPYDGTSLPGYIYFPNEVAEPVPAVVFIGGADSCKEEHHLLGPLELIEREMICLNFDGPGNGESLRARSLYTRADYEKVISAALDFLESQPEVNKDRIGIVGVSMGGYYAARGAAHDPRVKACISLSGLYDVGEGLYDFYPPIRDQLCYITGSKDQQETRERLRSFTLRGCLDKITCPYLIIHGAKDPIIPVSQAEKVYQECRCPKELKVWEEGLHNCNNIYIEARPYMWDWMTDKLMGGRHVRHP